MSIVSDSKNLYISVLPMCFVEDYQTYDKASLSNFYKQFDLFVSSGKPNYGV